MKRCHRCGTPWESTLREPAVKEICPQCNAFLHCCRNCRFHSPPLHNQCQIPNSPWVGDRTGCNFCDEFEFRDADAAEAERAAQARAREALGDVLGGVEPRPEAGVQESLLGDRPEHKDPKDRFKDLFGD